MTTLREVVEYAHTLWPLSGAEEWDAPGLVVGSLDHEIHKILFAVDAVSDTVMQSIENDVDLLITHHPLLMRSVTSVAEDRYKGHLVSELIRANVSLLAAHTNADVVVDGVSDVLARSIGVDNLVPLVPGSQPQTGIGRLGVLTQEMTLGQLAQLLADVLPNTAGGVKVSGEFSQPVSRVAVCGGAGDSLLSNPEVLSADVYITSDLRHHPAQEFREQALLTDGPALIDISHWAAEWLWLDTAASQLQEKFPDIDVEVSDLRTDPWDFLVVQ